MSGSPGYAQDGRLIGSVSYTLTWATPIAGITPAADMKKLFSGTSTTRAARTVKVSAKVAQRLAKTGEVTAAQADDGFARLKLPVTLTGARGKRAATFVKHLKAKMPDTIVRTGGPKVGAGAAATPADISAGGNFAGALSYGDFTAVGTGTTTMVCKDEAVAFGHPFLYAGKVQLSAHPATAVFVQSDKVLGPFKVANPGGVAGVITQDRTAGIRATLGATPSSFDVTTAISANGGAVKNGRTTVVYRPLSADIAALHVLTAIDSAFQAYGPGSGALTITVNGTRAGGKPFTLTRSDHYSSTFDLSSTVAGNVYTQLFLLLEQPFEKVTFTGVSVTGAVSDEVNQYRVTSLKVKKKGAWVSQKGVLTVTSGGSIPLRFTLTKYQSTDTRLVPITVAVPTKTKGASGSLSLSAGGEFFEESPSAKTFDGLLKSLKAAPLNDQLRGTLKLDVGSTTKSSKASARVDAAISNYDRVIDVQVKP
jgi:hypothetical protein